VNIEIKLNELKTRHYTVKKVKDAAVDFCKSEHIELIGISFSTDGKFTVATLRDGKRVEFEGRIVKSKKWDVVE